MKMENRFKKIGIIRVFIIGLVIIRCFYIWEDEQIRDNYYTLMNPEPTAVSSATCCEIMQTFQPEEKRLQGLELKLQNLPENAQGSLEVQLFDGEKPLYRTSIPLVNFIENEWHQVFLNVPLEKQSEYSLFLNVIETDVVPEVPIVERENASPEVIESSIEGNVLDGQVMIKYVYWKSPSNVDKILKITLWVVVAGIFIYYISIHSRKQSQMLQKMFCYLNKFISKGNNIGLLLLIEFLFGYLVFEKSGIGFQSNTKMVFWLISCFCVYKTEDKFRYLQKKLDTFVKKILFVLLNLYAAFSLVGNYLFLYPLDKEIEFSQILIYLITVIWFLPISVTFIYYYGNIKLKVSQKMSAVKFGVISTLLLIVPAAFALYAFNPGISTVDTSVCMVENAHAIRNALDWHPIFYCILLKGILKIWDSTYMVIFVQGGFWLYVILRFLYFMRKKGINDIFLLVITGFIGLNTANWLHICTIWKDVPYALTLLWLTFIIVQFIDELEADKHKWYIYLEMTIALVLCCLLRKNGVITYLIVVILVAWNFRKNIKIIGAVVFSAFMIVMIHGPLYSSLGIISPDDDEMYRGGKYIGLGQDVLGVYYGNGKVSSGTMQIVNGLTGFMNSEFGYNPYRSRSRYDLDIEMSDFIINYIDTFVHNPIIMTRAILCRHDAVWNIFPGMDSVMECVAFYGHIDGWDGFVVCHDPNSKIAVTWNDFYPKHEENEFSVLMARIADNSAKDQLLNLLEWRCGLHTLILVMGGYTLLLNVRKKKVFLAVVPFVGHVIGLLLSTGWSDFRYYWPLNLMSVFLILLIPTVFDREEGLKNETGDIKSCME